MTIRTLERIVIAIFLFVAICFVVSWGWFFWDCHCITNAEPPAWWGPAWAIGNFGGAAIYSYLH